MTSATLRTHRGEPERSGPRRAILRTAWIAVPLAVLAGIGIHLARGGGDPATRPGPPASRRVGGDPGEAAPDFAIPAAGGTVFRLSSHRGRAVVLDFLAPGCLSCAAEIANLAHVARTFRDEGVTVLVVDLGGMGAEQAAAYYRSIGGGGLAYGEDEGFRVARAYGVIDLGTTLVIDPGGVVAYRDSTYTARRTLVAEVRRALR